MAKKESQYKKPSYKEFNELKAFSKMLTSTAEYLKAHFVGKQLYFCTQKDTVMLVFKSSNYMHLCGVNYEKGANSFFSDCLNETIDISMIHVKKDGTTFQKLRVLSAIPLLLRVNTSLVKKGKYLYLEFDFAIRTRQQIVALTLNRTSGYYYPESLLNLKGMKKFASGERVECVYAVKLSDGTTTQIDVIEGKSISDYM